jgi:hypothetical protein
MFTNKKLQSPDIAPSGARQGMLVDLWEWAIALHGRVLVPLGWLQVIYCDMLLLSVYYLGYYFVLACC